MANNKKIFDKFNKEVNRVVIFAKAASINAHVDCMYPESFVIGILTTGANDVTEALVNMDIDLEKCLSRLKKQLGSKKSDNEVKGDPNYEDLKISKQVVDACKMANKIRTDVFGNDAIGVQEMFIALLRISSPIKTIFENEGLILDNIVDRMRRVKEPAETRTRKRRPSHSVQALESFCIDVTQQAQDNKLDPIISREAEIEKAITILCRRGKNNPILLGEPGVGKTAIVEGLSQRIVGGTVPKQLLNTHIYSLSLTGLVAGTKYRGEFEDRIQALVKEIQSHPNCILFIDEIHTLVGAGSAAGGALDASNILKPFLARSDLKCIGATTLEDFKKYFQKDGALTRRFQQVIVEEPTKEQVYRILSGIKHKYEEYHQCIISDDAIDAIINLTDRFQPDKNFPDKAIDCMDMACAKYVSWDTARLPATAKNRSNKNLVITADNIAKVVSEQCEIPIEVILWDDNERITKIEEILSSRVMGQKPAIDTVCRVLKNAYSGIRNPDKPIGSFVFGGQSGTGKTYMAKELAKAVFGRDTSFIRLDMTEFSEKHSVSKLIGSPPGYVGFQSTDIFIDKIKRKPYCIVLLDELEKADPDVMKMFLQVMSDGIMTDATGNRADFKNVILIMTGNFGSEADQKSSLGFTESDAKAPIQIEQERIIKYCQEKYGGEFINRVDEFVPFMPLGDEDLKKVIGMKLDEMGERLVNRKCKVSFTKGVYDLLLEKSKKDHGKNASVFDRLISREIEPCISDALLSLDKEFYTITIDAKNGDFVFSKRKRKAPLTKKKVTKKVAKKKATSKNKK
jgi:ATP-dependent Clp protease ATP-binding subunit ClpC